MKKMLLSIALITEFALAQSPGEIAGYTYQDLQENGSGTNRIAVMSDGGIYVCWTKSSSPNLFPRNIYSNYRSADGGWFGETPLSPENDAGFCVIDTGPDDCIAAYYHTTGDKRVHLVTTCHPIEFHVLPDTNSLWPKSAISGGGRFHVISGAYDYDNNMTTIMYNRSDDFGENWHPWTRIDRLETLIWSLNASDISERTAIVEGVPCQGGFGQYNIGYIISEDGEYWDISDWHLITNYSGSPNSAFADIDLIFDKYDYLHIVWNTYNTENRENSSTLRHWSEQSGEISEIASFGPVICEPASYNLAICKMSLGVDQDNNLFCVWTGFSSDDASAAGYCSGDLYMSYSLDGGANWAEYENITNSHTPGCVTGDCDSDNWATLAERVDENLHILYVNDKDAGAAVFYEGEATNNLMLYLEIPNPTLTTADENISLPERTAALAAYPNPFNTQTMIDFTLPENANIRLEIYDITGRRVQTVADGTFGAGKNSVIWDAKDLSSGVYFARISGRAGMLSKCLTLLK